MIQKCSSMNVYSNNWINVSRDEVFFTDGSIGEYGVIRHKAESVVVLVERGRELLFVSTFRYVTSKESLELPAGIIEKSEIPTEAACREVFEETNCVIGNCVELFSYYPSNGTSDQRMHVVKGTYESGEAISDNSENSKAFWIPSPTAIECIKNNKIQDGPTIIALLYSNSYRV